MAGSRTNLGSGQRCIPIKSVPVALAILKRVNAVDADFSYSPLSRTPRIQAFYRAAEPDGAVLGARHGAITWCVLASRCGQWLLTGAPKQEELTVLPS